MADVHETVVVARRDKTMTESDASLAKSSSQLSSSLYVLFFSCPSGEILRDFGSKDFATM